MTTRRPLMPLTAAGARRWLRALLLCALFSALHGTVGAWVVPSVSNGSAVQICTPQGMQWVGLGELAGEGDGGEPMGAAASALQPCVWAAAHVAIGSAAPPSAWVPEPCPAVTPAQVQPHPPQSDHARRVLLMSAMRAPPPAVG